MIDVQYGIPVELVVPEKFGVRAVIANITITDTVSGQKEDDAALILLRRSFGVGRSHLILRQNMHQVLDTEALLKMAFEASERLYGIVHADIAHKIADLILDHTDQLVMHPPEDAMIEKKRQAKLIETSGLLVNLNGETLLDAR